MSRQINMADPDSWSDDDKAYLRDRGVTHPALNADAPTVFAPAQHAVSEEVQTLKLFLEDQYADELGVEGETPVATAIRLLGNAKGYDANAAAQADAVAEPDDEYDEWKVSELRDEAGTRDGFDGEPATMRKADLIAALRAWDAQHPEANQV